MWFSRYGDITQDDSHTTTRFETYLLRSPQLTNITYQEYYTSGGGLLLPLSRVKQKMLLPRVRFTQSTQEVVMILLPTCVPSLCLRMQNLSLSVASKNVTWQSTVYGQAVSSTVPFSLSWCLYFHQGCTTHVLPAAGHWPTPLPQLAVALPEAALQYY